MEYIDIFDENNNSTGEIKEKTQAHQDGNFREKMFDVIDAITKWDRFSKTESKFYVEIKEEKDSIYSYSVIFENGYAACGEYRRKFGEKIKITKF